MKWLQLFSVLALAVTVHSAPTGGNAEMTRRLKKSKPIEEVLKTSGSPPPVSSSSSDGETWQPPKVERKKGKTSRAASLKSEVASLQSTMESQVPVKVPAKRPRKKVAAEAPEIVAEPTAKRVRHYVKKGKKNISPETSHQSSPKPTAEEKGKQIVGQVAPVTPVVKDVKHDYEPLSPQRYDVQDWTGAVENSLGPHDMNTRKWTLDDFSPEDLSKPSYVW